jgi:biopolymer transport protein ExbD
MNRNDCESVLHLHRTFLPHRRTGRGFLTGTVFLDAALLITAFTLATSPFVRKPGIALDLPVATQVGGIRFNDTVLSISGEGLFFFNDEIIRPDSLETVLRAAFGKNPDATLILEADKATSQATASAVYDAAARAGFRRIFIATQTAEPVQP